MSGGSALTCLALMTIPSHGARVPFVNTTIMVCVPAGAIVGFFMIIPLSRLLESAGGTGLGNEPEPYLAVYLTFTTNQDATTHFALLAYLLPTRPSPYCRGLLVLPGLHLNT